MCGPDAVGDTADDYVPKTGAITVSLHAVEHGSIPTTTTTTKLGHSIQFHHHPGALLKHNATPIRGNARPTAEDMHAAGPSTQTAPCTPASRSCSHSGALSQLHSKVADKFLANPAGINVLARPAHLVGSELCP
jgi:hypothetical protein